MELPFTSDQFFAVFAEYNRVFAPVVFAWWLASVVFIWYVWADPPRRSRALSTFLGALWVWNALAYHALLFTRINPAAWPFAGLFLLQGVLFLRMSRRRDVEYLSGTGWTHATGVALMGYGLAYPFLTIASGHLYPAAPSYGVPCPTNIFTIGALLTVRGEVPIALSIVPVLWGLIGGSAAVLLEVPADFALLAASLLLVVAVAKRQAAAPARHGHTRRKS